LGHWPHGWNSTSCKENQICEVKGFSLATKKNTLVWSECPVYKFGPLAGAKTSFSANLSPKYKLREVCAVGSFNARM